LNTKSKSHLTLEQRIEIQGCLSHGMTFKAIAKRIHKDQTTVSREVKNRAVITPTTAIRLDKDKKPIVAVCPKLSKPPFVCNPCPNASRACSFDRHHYRAKQAHAAYEHTLSNSREGIPLTKQEFYDNDRIISDAVQQGQRVYHIVKTNELNVSIPTVYRHIKKGYMSFCSVDLPRAVKFKARKAKSQPYVPKGVRIGRTYEDFLAFTAHNEITSWVETDTVIGRIGGKTILTLHFTDCNFMFGLLLNSKSASDASLAFVRLKKLFADHGIKFGDVIPLLLTDNGGEFANVFDIENDLVGERESRIFFCDPYCSSQKPHVEKNHTLFRDIVPQGSSFDDFTQETVNTIFSHKYDDMYYTENDVDYADNHCRRSKASPIAPALSANSKKEPDSTKNNSRNQNADK